jgi:PIN domain nuclease of toxin-antitoxin system
MIRAIADTHSAIWYLFDDPRLSQTARDRIEEIAGSGDHLAVSSVSLVEIVYLAEKGKISDEVFGRVIDELDSSDSLLVETPLDRRVVTAMQKIDRALVPDLPDRVIAATGYSLGVPVITKDSDIRQSAVQTIW